VPIVIACSAGLDLDASGLIREVTAALGGRGGGTVTMAQGGVPATPERVIEFVRQRLSAVS
jgi:alanyl-tRNA synthetase